MSDYVARLTVICPEALMDKANNLAAVLGKDLADLNTFSYMGYEDALGNKYSLSSGMIKQIVLDDAGGPLVRPDCDTGNVIDMVKAAEAQALIKWDLTDVTGSLSCSLSDDYFGFIASAGLTKIQVEV